MNRTAIRWVIALMGISVMGLAIFQVYWIESVIRANEQGFKRDVQEALNFVAEKLEQQEALHLAVDNFHTQFVWKSQSSANPSELELIESTFEKKVVEIKDFVSDSVGFPLGMSFYFDTDDEEKSLDNVTIEFQDNINGEKDRQIHLKGDSLNQGGLDLEIRLRKVAKKSEYVQMALHELISGGKSIKKRLEPGKLDSLLAIAFDNEGINLKYEFGVVDPLSHEMVIKKVRKGHQKLLESSHKANLFPNDIMGEAGYIMVYFPNEQTYLLKKIWFTLLSAIILILIITFCFSYAILTIFRQKKLSEIKNDFINNMTHEFKTPISTVSLACEALQDPEINATHNMRDRYLSIIGDENKRLGLQVEKVLQMAVIERKDFKLKLEQVNVHEIINKAMGNIALQVSKRGGIISKELNAVKQTLEADEMHLTNIVYNLLDNANKYSQEKPEIKISTEDTSTGISISILDRGIGMSKEVISRIFDKFYRIPTGNIHDVKGFGLGLAYVKNMVEAHGGNVQVTSEMHKGSHFKIFLPYNFNHQ